MLTRLTSNPRSAAPSSPHVSVPPPRSESLTRLNRTPVSVARAAIPFPESMNAERQNSYMVSGTDVRTYITHQAPIADPVTVRAVSQRFRSGP